MLLAPTSYAQRHTLVSTVTFDSVDKAVEKCLPPGIRVTGTVPWAASAWTVTSKVTAERPDGTAQTFFLKTTRERGATMMEGEYNSLKAITEACEGLAPTPYGWGQFESAPDTYFLVIAFIDLKNAIPDANKLCQLLAEMHENSVSPTGKFGFHVPTCHGRNVQPNDWDDSWPSFFTRLITSFFDEDIRVNGHWPEYEEAFRLLTSQVIPRLLDPLQADGRKLKPSLVHGDLWEDNTGIDVKTGRPVFFDAAVFYGHNEYDLGMWRRDVVQIGSQHFKQYLHRIPPSEPAEQWDDRNLLYSLKFELSHSSHWPNSDALRQDILVSMKALIEKYPAAQ